MNRVCDFLFGPMPYKEGSKEGVNLSVAKMAIIGSIVAAALAVGIYYSSMAIYNSWNPFNLSLSTQTGLVIFNSCLIGLLVLGCTAYKVKETLDTRKPE